MHHRRMASGRCFIRDWNLWVRDIATGKETQLTTDGVKDFGYATDNAGWARSERPIVVWSPDSKQVATFQQDQRNVGEMYLVSTKVGHPELQAWKYPLPGDDVVAMIQRVVVDVGRGARSCASRWSPTSTARRSATTSPAAATSGRMSQWAPDSRSVAFVSTSRDHRKTTLRIADPGTGEVRDVLAETVSTFFESGNGRVNWRYLPASNEVIWFSERDNWGQLYLYDLQTGKVKRQITAARATSRSWSASTRSADSCSCRRSATRRGATRISLISTRSNMDGGQLGAAHARGRHARDRTRRTPAITSWTATRRPSVRRWQCSAT